VVDCGTRGKRRFSSAARRKSAVANPGKLVVLVLCLTVIGGETRVWNPFSKSQASASSARNSSAIPFCSSRMAAGGSRNGVKERNLLIDTGTKPTALDVAVRRMLGADPGEIRAPVGRRFDVYATGFSEADRCRDRAGGFKGGQLHARL
jgi:hypothetical protein